MRTRTRTQACVRTHAHTCARVQAELEPLQKRSLAELKELCALNGLHKKGVKADLVARLLDALCVLRGS